MSKSNQRFFDFIWKMVIDIGKDYEDDPLLTMVNTADYHIYFTLFERKILL